MAARYPAAAEPAARIIAFYLRESFGDHPLEDGERETEGRVGTTYKQGKAWASL
jgi:hypothetical protein